LYFTNIYRAAQPQVVQGGVASGSHTLKLLPGDKLRMQLVRMLLADRTEPM
jgi:hypothetical protein